MTRKRLSAGGQRLPASNGTELKTWRRARREAAGEENGLEQHHRRSTAPRNTATPLKGRDELGARRGARAEARCYLGPRRGEIHHTPQVGRVALPIEAKKPAEGILPALPGQGRCRHFGQAAAGGAAHCRGGASRPLPAAAPKMAAPASTARAVVRRSRRLFDIFVAEVPWTVSTSEFAPLPSSSTGARAGTGGGGPAACAGRGRGGRARAAALAAARGCRARGSGPWVRVTGCVCVSPAEELKEYFSQFGSVQRCQLPFVSTRSSSRPLFVSSG